MNPLQSNTPEVRAKSGAGKSLKQTVFATTALSLGMGIGAPAALAQDAVTEATDIVVTARRVEERLQDVPISITVFNQEDLSNQNINNTADLALYTPSLQANTRYGSDYSSFSIRGFAQEQRTTASVATYFADVVTPRGGPTLSGGDGAGPGNLFDLQNVQVLNGPQGTLFGRNTTGGAVLLVPQRPTDEFGGYVELSAGDYDMNRQQAVLNIPFSSSARLRLGMDRQEREGYTNNRSGIGPDHFSDINYEAYRASFVANLTPSLENYTILNYTHALTNGTVPRYVACQPGAGFLGSTIACLSQAIDFLGSGETFNHNDFYDVWNADPDPQFSNNQWQFINTTTWDVTDNLTIKNILGYSEIKAYTRGDVFGTCFDFSPGSPCVTFANSGQWEDLDSGYQSTFSEELQFQGQSSDRRLIWQAGLYFEESDPQALTGSVSNSASFCADTTSGDPTTWNCFGGSSIPAGPLAGNNVPITQNLGSISYQNQAVYTQVSYNFTERLKLTAGYRYTWDRTDGRSLQSAYVFTPGGAYVTQICTNGSTDPDCEIDSRQRSEAPTWNIGVDYNLTDDDMVYAKYSRGYRQGAANIFGQVGLQSYGPEHVDSYEIGAKTAFDGPVPGIFNIALFYNDLSDAQLQAGFIVPPAPPTTAIINAGGVTTYGAEIQTVLELFEDFNVSLAYSYLNTNVDSAPPLPSGATPLLVYVNGQELYYAPEHSVTLGVDYRLPLPEMLGDITLGATYAWMDEQLVSVDAPMGTLPSVGLLNLNANWEGIGGSPVDASLFVTNATDEEYYSNRAGGLNYLGVETGNQGAPRMIGARLRYRFGGEAD